MSQMIDLDSFSQIEIFILLQRHLKKIQRLMGVNINKDLQVNLYARIRIEEHLKDINKVSDMALF